MAQTFSTEATGPLNTIPATNADGAVVGGRLRRYRATIDLASQASGDTIVLGDLPQGFRFAFGLANSSVSLATSTLAIGVEGGTAAEFRAAAVLTTANSPVLFGLEAAAAEADAGAVRRAIATVGVAALPASGQLVIDLYGSNG